MESVGERSPPIKIYVFIFYPKLENPNIPSSPPTFNNFYFARFYMIRYRFFYTVPLFFILYVRSFCFCFCLINLSLIELSSGFYAPCALFLTLGFYFLLAKMLLVQYIFFWSLNFVFYSASACF